jgi:hypothetical protein
MASKTRIGTMTIDELRTQIAKTQAELATLDAAALPIEEAERNLAAALEQLAGLYTPDAVVRGFSRTPAPGFDAIQLLLSDPRYDVQNFHAFLAATFGATLLEGWRARLRALYAADPALAEAVPSSQRPARRAALEETLLELSIAEERSICEAERHGQQIDRRPDADPRAIFHESVLEPVPAT